MPKKLIIENIPDPVSAFGVNYKILRIIEREMKVSIFDKGNTIRIEGEEEALRQTEALISHILHKSQSGTPLSERDVLSHIKKMKNIPKFTPIKQSSHRSQYRFYFPQKGKLIKPLTPNQELYVSEMFNNDITIAIGPAGTGKTYIAVVVGLHLLQSKLIERLILTRPVVEAGESLGYLPGDFEQKINPYLRPLFDAILDIIPAELFIKYKEHGIIEIAPLAYMRGRTLNNAFIILDEAQNTTISQMKMFLTRLGFNSKMVITGDITQSDLPSHRQSGLAFIAKHLKNIEGISLVELSKEDIQRHPLIEHIINAFSQIENSTLSATNPST